MRDRFRQPAQEVILAVAAPQIGVHMAQRPVPVDPGQSELAEIGQKGVGQCAALPREAVGALGHPVADRKVALLLADRQQGVGQLHGPGREQSGDQGQLGAVDVPHRADVEHEGPVGGPHVAFLRREARLDQRMVESGGEDRLPGSRGGLDLDLVEVLAPHRRGLRAPALEGRGARSAVSVKIELRLLHAAK